MGREQEGRGLFEEHLVAVAAHGGDEAGFVAGGGFDAAAQTADHAVNVGVVDIALGFGPDGLGDVVFADDAAAVLVEKPKQVELFDAERRVEQRAVYVDLAGGGVDAQSRFAHGDERRRGDGGGGVVEAEGGGGEGDLAAVFQPSDAAGGEFDAVEDDAVFAVEVVELLGAIHETNFGVVARGKLVFDDDVGVGGAAHDLGARREVNFASGAGTIETDQFSVATHSVPRCDGSQG